MWQHCHAAGRSDWAWALCNKEHLKWRGFFSSAFLVQAGGGEHLKRSAKVEDLNVLKQDNANPLSCHLNLDAASPTAGRLRTSAFGQAS
jgi:hypothetical protein